MATVDISLLQYLAKTYAKDLKTYPYAVLMDEVRAMGINLYPGVQNKDLHVFFERKGGIAKPYEVGLTVSNAELGKLVESELEVKTAYASVVDNIKNYQEKIIISANEMIGANQTKKHPFQVQQMMAMLKTFSEDILYIGLFHGTRDEEDLSPSGIMDGLLTKLAALISSGAVAAENGNYAASGSLAAPAEGETGALDNLIAWVRQADAYLLRNANLLLTRGTYANLIDCLENKYAHKDATLGSLNNYINERSGGNIKLITSQAFGTGEKLLMFTPGNLDFGMNSMGDHEFVQLLPPALGDDPNNFGYWIQGDYGSRIRSFNSKMLFTNESTNTANDLSGDYRS